MLGATHGFRVFQFESDEALMPDSISGAVAYTQII